MKKCKTCLIEKPITDFFKNGKYKDRIKYKPNCKICEISVRKDRIKGIIKQHYGLLACMVCGYDKSFDALDCHHRITSEKENEISNMATMSEDVIKKELSKCDLVCANCHREIHAYTN